MNSVSAYIPLLSSTLTSTPTFPMPWELDSRRSNLFTATQLKDDEELLKEPWKSLRLTFLLEVVNRHLPNEELSLKTWLALLENSEDDIWLWADGDEKEISRRRASSKPEIDATIPMYEKAASALSRRFQQIQHDEDDINREKRRRRVQEATPSARFGVIVWLVLTSKAIKDAEATQKREALFFPRYLVDTWRACCTQIAIDIKHTYTFDWRRFRRNMEAAGHCCHQSRYRYVRDFLNAWLGIRSLLSPERCDDVTYFGEMRRYISCKPCYIMTDLLECSSCDQLPASYTPPPHLLLLQFIWWTCSKHGSFITWLECACHIVLRNKSPLINASTLKAVNTQLDGLAPRKWLEKWNSQFDFILESYRHTYMHAGTLSFSSMWLKAHNILQETQTGMAEFCNDTEQGRTSGPVNLRVWIGAITFMPTYVLLTWRANIRNYRLEYFNFATDSEEMDEFLAMIPPFHEEPFVVVFRRMLQESQHICFKDKNWAWRVSAAWLITGNNLRELRPLVRSFGCSMCQDVESPLLNIFNKAETLFPAAGPQARLDAILQELAVIAVQQHLRFELPEPSSAAANLVALALDADNDTARSDLNEAASRIASIPDDPVADTPSTELTTTARPARYLSTHKTFMVDKIKAHLIEQLEAFKVPIGGITGKSKLLPWTTLPQLLAERGIELDGWPTDVPLPGRGGQQCDDNKGINGLDKQQLLSLYDAVKSKTHPLGLRRIDAARQPTTVDDSMDSGSPSARESAVHCVDSDAPPTAAAAGEGTSGDDNVLNGGVDETSDFSHRRHRDSRDDIVDRPSGKRPRLSSSTYSVMDGSVDIDDAVQ